jgi:hypothetical protein
VPVSCLPGYRRQGILWPEMFPFSARLRARLAWGAALVLVGAGLFTGYLFQSRTTGADSDGSSIAIQAWDMLHGNMLLSGWWLGDVSFYTTELPEYMLVEAVRGLGPDDVHVCAALTYTLLVLLAALVARGRATGRAGVVRALVAGGIMVAPALGYGSNTLLLSPDHTGTGVPLLVLLLLLDRVPAGWYLPVIMLFGLAWAQVADPLATFAMAIPVAFVGVFRLSLRRWVTGLRTESAWYDVALAVAGGASFPLTRAALSGIRELGGCYVPGVPGALFASSSVLVAQARTIGQCVLMLFGADIIGWYPPTGIDYLIAVLHLVGVALAAVGFVLAIGRFFGTGDRVSQILVAGLGVVLFAGWLGTHMSSIFDTHEIAVVLPFGAALAGRQLGDWVARVGAGWFRWVRRGVVTVLAVSLAGYLAVLGYGAAQPARPAANQDLAQFLVAHGLHEGLAGYWQANSVSLDSREAVELAPIFGPAPYIWESRYVWYDPAVSDANFVVMVSSPASEQFFARPSVILRDFGKPAQTYHFEQYIIMVWNRNLLTSMVPVNPAGVQLGQVPAHRSVPVGAHPGAPG